MNEEGSQDTAMQETSIYDNLMIGALLVIPTQIIGRKVVEAVAAHGFQDYRPTYQPVFQWCRPEGSRVGELAERAGITKQSMGEIINTLEERGYVERVPDPTDGRAVLVRRTERGWEINRVARQVVEQIQWEWAQVLGPEQFTSLLEGLRHLARVLDEPVGSGGAPQAATPTRATAIDRARKRHGGIQQKPAQ